MVTDVAARLRSIEGWIFGPESNFPHLLLIRVTDQDGHIGHGETFYLPAACWEVIEGLLGPSLLERHDPNPQSFWHESSRALRRFVGMGAELRALSALDVALWDLDARRKGIPLASLLSPSAASSVAVYNSCVGPTYAAGARAPSEGGFDVDDSRDDYAAWKQGRGGELATDLLAAGFHGMKLWPFDELAKRVNGAVPTPSDLRAAAEPLRDIRDAVGDRMAVMIDGHGLWTAAGAAEVARTCADFDIAWLEDLVLAHPLDDLRQLRSATELPILASEYLSTTEEYRELLESGIADIVMIDPTWAGGITASHRHALLANEFGKPVSFHDCTGPVTLMAGIHLGAAIPNHHSQEIARGFLHYSYPEIAQFDCTVADGRTPVPQAPGLGLEFAPELRNKPGIDYRLIEQSK